MKVEQLFKQFLEMTADIDPVIKAVRALVKRELAWLEKARLNPGRPRLDDSPKRQKWRDWQRAYRARKKGET